jgi:hypothetical protein
MKQFSNRFRTLFSIPAVCITVVACGDNNGPTNNSSTATTQTANATVASIGESNTPVVANPTLADKAAAIIGSWGAGESCIVENGVDLPGGIQIAKSMNVVRRFESVDANTLRVVRTGNVYNNPGCYGTPSPSSVTTTGLVTIDEVNVVAGRTHVLFTEQSGNKGLFAVSADNAKVMEGKRTVLPNAIQATHPTVVLQQSALFKDASASLTPRPCAQETTADTIKYCLGSEETTVVSPLANNSMSTSPDMARFWDGLTIYLRFYPNAQGDETYIELSRDGGANFFACSQGGNVQSTTRPICSVGSYSRGSTLVPSNTRVTLQSASPTVLVVDRTSGLGLYDSSKYVAISSGLIQAPGF